MSGNINLQKPKRVKKKCPHGREKPRCRDCGGSQICEHNKDKARCKDCGGSQVCKHGKIKSGCIECGGNSICEHKRQRATCKDCGGGAICEHNRIRSKCMECHGGSICEHGHQRIRCVECGGSQICEHKKRRNQCVECEGSQICEHKKRRNECIECEGSQICEHNKKKAVCKDCGGSQICEHGKRKSYCKDCDGSQICEHGSEKSYCRICDPPIHPENWCQLCKFVYIRKSQYKPYCFTCYCALNPDAEIKKQYKLKEHHLRDELLKSYPNIKMIFDSKVDNGCSLRRPDVRIECFTHTIIIECDENKHQGYSCENKRIMEIFQDLGNRPIVFLRFNPDQYTDENGNKINGCFKKTNSIDNSLQTQEWTRRMIILKERLDYHYKNIPTKEVTTENLFY